MEGLGGLPSVASELVHLWEGEHVVPSSGWAFTQPFVFENHKEAPDWL